jgi:chorismate mutase/prephenate dehydratase
MADPPDLDALRQAIEAVDREILDRLRHRMDLVEGVARAKLHGAFPFRDRPREERVLLGVRRLAVERGLDPHAVEGLYRLVMDMSVAHQVAFVQARGEAPLRVGYQGVEGAYSHLAAQGRYGGRHGGTLLVGFETFRLAIDALRRGEVDVALLPIENSTAGSIDGVYDLLAEGGLAIDAEVVTPVEHCLLALPGVELAEIRTVVSHPQALAQCERFVHALPGVVARESFDTAGAARQLRDAGDRSVAAIASRTAAALFGLAVLRERIQDAAANATRFVEIAMHAVPVAADAACKTSLLLTLPDRPGALATILGELARHGVNLTKLESRPDPHREVASDADAAAGSPWRYRFYLDVEGHAATPPLADALAAIRPLTASLVVLGTYPRAQP